MSTDEIGDVDDFYEDVKKDKDSKKGHDYESLTVFNIMRSEDGRKFMWEHLQSCGVFENIFDKDTNQHSFNAGQRAAGLKLECKLKEFEVGFYVKMIKENLDG